MMVLDSSIANIALPAIGRDLGAAPSESIWIVNAYQIGIVMALLPLASLGEIIGYRTVYRIGLTTFILASLCCALSRSMPVLTIARAVQGLGAAGVMSVNGALVRFTYPHHQLGRGIGLNALAISVSSALGPTVASAILAVGPWQWLFGVNIPVGIAAIALGWRTLPPNPLSGRRFDGVSAALNAAAFGLIFLSVDLLTRTRAKIMGAAGLVSGVLIGAVLVRRELRRPRPLVPFDLLRRPIFALSACTSIASFAGQMLTLVALPFHFENSLHYSQVETGLLMTPWPTAVGLTAPAAGWLADRLSVAVLCAIGLLLFAVGLGSLALAPYSAGPFDIGWRMVLCGVGFGLFQSPNNRMMLSSAPHDRTGAAGGVLATSRLAGQTIGAAGAAILLHLLAARGEVVGLWIAAVLGLAGAALSLSRKATGPQPPL